MINVNDFHTTLIEVVSEQPEGAAFGKVILLNPPSPTGYVSNKDSMGGYGQLYPLGATFLPPLDLVYLASYLTSKNVPLGIIESLGLELNKDQMLERIGSASAVDGDGQTLLVIRTSLPTLDWDLPLSDDGLECDEGLG